MKIHHYDEQGYYTATTRGARPPARATGLALPETPWGANRKPRFQNGAWTLAEDYRGQPAFHVETGASASVEQPGPLPAGLTLQDPAQVDSHPRRMEWLDFNGQQWVVDAAVKSAVLREELNARVLAEAEARKGAVRVTVAGKGEFGGVQITPKIDMLLRKMEAESLTEASLSTADKSARPTLSKAELETLGTDLHLEWDAIAAARTAKLGEIQAADLATLEGYAGSDYVKAGWPA